ncbi:MAG: MoxR family ATPase [Ruminococcaceae bacterium]|nr:MoxR family ATPase [Oscillospiraceae bacterium]
MSGIAYATYKSLKENISRIIVGKDESIDLLIVSLFCRGHVLIEDVPGTGKTMMVKSLAASSDAECRRIQFTPDLLPSDITGVNFFNMKTSEFEFVKGPVFSNILIADEINRATPKTQSGLLECMEERQTTVDGKTYRLPDPFMVVATQNPVENMGVFPLPEAQLDRFLIKISMKYPSHEESIRILERFAADDPLASLEPSVSKEDILEAQKETDKIFVHRDIMSYAVSITEATHHFDSVSLGASPRAAIALIRTAKGLAAISGRDFVKPDDVKRAVLPVLEHRIILNTSARMKKNAAANVLDEIIKTVPVPTEEVLEG